MNLLLDTHALIWFLENDARLSRQARLAIEDLTNRTYVSDATAWEMGIKVSSGKLELPVPYGELFPVKIENLGFHILPIQHRHLHLMITLPHHHRDPFDRLLIAQALADRMILISHDSRFPAYGVPLLW